jgi:flagellar protein FliO/FliZ
MRFAAPALVALAAGGFAAGAAAADAAPVDLAPSLVQTAFGLAFVIALIYAGTWLLRRMQPGGQKNALVKVVASVSVGQRERVVLVEFADQWLLVGVATGGVTLIQQAPKGEMPPAAAAPTFARMLAAARGGKPK